MSIVASTTSVFASELSSRLISKGWEVEMPSFDNYADFIVKDKASDKRIFIDIKDAKGYGELPISTILPIANMVRNNSNDRVILVSFSTLSSLLFKKLQELKVLPLVKPSIDEVIREVGVAMAS